MSALDEAAAVRTENRPQGICIQVVWDGLPGHARYNPNCYWSSSCKAQGCFWRRFHQIGAPEAKATQQGLDL